MIKRFYYDLHTHSCLSPCADNDNTPNNLAGMAALCGIHILALTDHNTCKNCPAFFVAARRNGVIPVAGMELTTSEDIHVVCLFEKLSDAMRFDREIESHRFLIENRPDIFGDQLILDGDDNIIGIEDNLLSNATDISCEEVRELAMSFGGIAYPAHIDRSANGIIEVLGAFPETPGFQSFEIRDGSLIEEYRLKYSIKAETCVISSDAHYLTDLKDAENYFDLDCDSDSEDDVRRALFKILR